MIKNISHITFIVKDLEKSTKFLETIFNAKKVYCSGEKLFSLSEERFFLINDLWIAIMKGDSLKEKTYNHIAFQIDESEFDEYKNKIIELGLEIKDGRKRISGEGLSLYFYDYDNHLFEIHTGNLDDRLKCYSI